MISLYRIGAIVFRHLMTFKRLSWIIEIGYWTTLDIIIFGSLGKSAALMGSDGALVQVLISNAVLWYLVLRSAITIGFCLLNELFDANLITLFATPLKKIEWIISCIIVGTIAALINLLVGIIMALLVFNCNIFAFGLPLIAFIGSLLLSGWILGLILMGVLLFVGKKGVSLTFVICWSVVPFSCVYYPLEVFPLFLQKIAWVIPMTRIFVSTRAILTIGLYSPLTILSSFGLNLFYLPLAIAFFAFMFNRSKKRGLARLELGW